jgi:uncharacterized protein (DUF433 family)
VIVSKGAYTADRAAALAGVPVSTVRYWAKKEILEPSVSQRRVMLWGYPDLMGLRMIYWLRQVKELGDGRSVPRSSMPAVRKALAQLRELDLDLWSRDSGFSVAADRAGNLHVDANGSHEAANRQRLLDRNMVDLVRPFDTPEHTRGPDLHRPRPQLRIVPGKLGGEPHIKRTRLETQALAALARRGLQREKIYRLYPIAPGDAIDEAIDLEKQLRSNLAAAAA